MKNINVILIGFIGLVFIGCSKEVDVNLDVPGADKYSMVYMPLARENNIEKGISIDESVYSLNFSAYLGGSRDNKSNINLSFEVLPTMVDAFNLKNGTNYSLMPLGSFELDNPNAVIGTGKKSSDLLHVSVKTKGFLEPFKTYLLPISLTGSSAQINEKLSTVYYLITGAYAPGEVPRTKAYSFGSSTGYSLFSLDQNLMQKTTAGDMMFYLADANGGFDTPVKKGQGWDIYNLVFYYGGVRLVTRGATGSQDLVLYNIDANGNVGGARPIGYGWNVFKRIIPYKGLLLGINEAGEITMYPMNVEGIMDYAQIKVIASGWGGFVHVVPYENSLLAIDGKGDMYQYPLSENGIFGTRKKLGDGWDMYVSVVASGSDLLCLDAHGDLWRYKFSSLGYWPLKK